MSDAQLRADVVEYAHLLAARGWVANHDGNITIRLGDGHFLATPTATAKARVSLDTLLVIDDQGSKVGIAGGKPFSESSLHLAVYAARPDVRAVVHAHPPMATGFAVAGVGLDTPFIAEAVVSIGPGIPMVPFAAPGATAAAALVPYLAEHDAVLLGNHGVLTWGADVEQAFLRMELVEHLAKVALVAHQLGGVQPLPASVLPTLADARAKAGLGPRGRDAASAAAVPGAAPRNELGAIIREEIARALRGS
ncbi:MAG: class II aldolase/adducin family protein [Polyangia bacterium]